jgi:type II secretory pathway predicted ATPase ExeA
MKSSEMLSYFGLCEPPFSKELPTEHLQILPSVQRNLASARLLVDTRGIGVISGKAGTGKTSLLRLLFDSLPPGLFKSFYLCHSSVGMLEFYTHLCVLFGLEPCSRRAAMFRELQSHILTLATVSHVHPVLAIDEAHLLSNDMLAEIRLLTNFRLDSLNALTVILCGNETFTRKLGLSTLESLATSITVTVSVDSLSAEESASYIESRISACGQKAPLFTKNAMILIHQASGGILRTIATIASASLLKAFLAGSKQVEAEHVQSVIQR